MRLTQGQVRAILRNMESRSVQFIWTENLPLELCKHIKYYRGKWRCTKLHGKQCEVDGNGCHGFDVKEVQ